MATVHEFLQRTGVAELFFDNHHEAFEGFERLKRQNPGAFITLEETSIGYLVRVRVTRAESRWGRASDDLRRALTVLYSGLKSDAKPTALLSPPPGAEQLVAFFCPPKLREQTLGDLEEAFRCNVDLMGARKAAASYWYQVIASVAAFVGPRLLGWTGVAALLRKMIGN